MVDLEERTWVNEESKCSVGIMCATNRVVELLSPTKGYELVGYKYGRKFQVVTPSLYHRFPHQSHWFPQLLSKSTLTTHIPRMCMLTLYPRTRRRRCLPRTSWNGHIPHTWLKTSLFRSLKPENSNVQCAFTSDYDAHLYWYRDNSMQNRDEIYTVQVLTLRDIFQSFT
jgi:hypothetical protein